VSDADKDESQKTPSSSREPAAAADGHAPEASDSPPSSSKSSTKAESKSTNEGDEVKPVAAKPTEKAAEKSGEKAVAPRVDEIAKRAFALGEEDALEKIAREEEEKLAARREEARKARKKGALESAASKKLGQIGTKPKKKKGSDNEEDEAGDDDASEATQASDFSDPLVDRSALVSKWVDNNKRTLLYAFAAGAVALGGFFAFTRWKETKENDASSALAAAVLDERGRIGDPEKEPEGAKDPTPMFKTIGERQDSALGKYKDVQAKHPQTGAAILARLGEASILLDKKNYDGAFAAFGDVKKSALALADKEVRGRAIEGVGFALEGKAQFKDALANYKELETSVEVDGFKELAMYHQARMHAELGEKDKAKELLVTVRERVQRPGSSFPYLKEMVDERLRSIDPSAVPAAGSDPLGGLLSGPMGAGGQPSPLQRKLQQEYMKKLQQKKGGGGHGDEH
jgi:hypothetical protein